MSHDRRITPYRPDLADERLRGLVAAERFATGTAMRVVAPSAPVRRHPSPDALRDTEALMGEAVTVYDEHEGFAAGTAWADVPDDWCCPDCGVRDKVDFVPCPPEPTVSARPRAGRRAGGG